MSRIKRACVALSVTGLLAVVSLWPTGAQAQRRRMVPAFPVEDGMAEDQTLDGLTIPKDREATAIITAAKEYVIKKDWDTVARSLQYLLEKPEDSFFEYKRKDEKGKEYTARISIRIEANRLIGELPPEGLETYRQKYGQKAMLMLQDGIDHNDPATLSMVALRYRHTEAGVKAIHLLGNYFLDRGNYQLASGKFQELLELLDKEKPEVKKEIGPKTFFKAALAYQRFGDSEMAEKLWKQVVEQVGEKGLAFGKQTYTLQTLRAEFERNAQVGAKSLTSVPVLRGDPSRTAQGIGGVPILESSMTASMFVPDPSKETRPFDLPWYILDWQPNRPFLKTAEWVQDKVRGAADILEKTSSNKRPILPGFFPIAGDNRIIFRTYDGVYAYFLHDDPAKQQIAGTLAWASEAVGSLHNLGSESGGVRSTFDSWWSQYTGANVNGGGVGSAMPSILFENSTVGTLSHDNSLVYYVDDLSLPPPPSLAAYGGWGMGNGVSYGVFTDPVLYNTLRAIEMDTGKMNWEIGGRKQSGKVPVIQPNMGVRMGIGPNGRPIQIGPDGKPIEKQPEPEKPFVLPKELPESKGFVNAGDELLDTFFLGPPLPIGGKLYLLVEYNGEIQLCCLNPKRLGVCKEARVTWPASESTVHYDRAPELVWRQPLGTCNQRLFQDTMRRIQPCHLAYNDGILICPTNAGAIIAVNLLTQSLAWAYSYRTSVEPADAEKQMMQGGMGFRGGRGFRIGEVNMNLAADRWYPAPPAIVNGNVIFTAPDSDSLICLSLRDGQRRWAVKRQAGDLYMAGVYDNKVLVVGKNSIRALKLTDGTPAWDREQPIGTPSGQGVASNGKYYLPCKNGGIEKSEPQILEINIDTGATHATKSRHKEVPGNLIFFDGEVISQSITNVSVYPQLFVKLAEMNARLNKNPNDPAGLIDRGELNLDKGELALAIVDLKTALEFKPAPDLRAKARLKLYEALTEQLRNHFNQGEKHLSLYQDLCLNEVDGDERAKRQSAYLCLLGRGREAQGKLGEAFDAYMEFSRLNGDRNMVRSVDESETLCRADVWARGRIMAMIKNASPEQSKPIEERVSSKWREVKATDDIEKIRKYVQEFGSMFTSGLEARLDLARRLMLSTASEDLTQAEIELKKLREQRDNIAIAAEATETEARLDVKKGLLRDAVQLYRTLGTEFKDVKLSDGRTGADVYNELITDKRFLPYLDLNTHVWEVGPMKGEMITGANGVGSSIYFSVDPEGDVMPFFRQHRLVIDTQGANGASQIRLIDRATGEVKWSFAGLPQNAYQFEDGNEWTPFAGHASGRNSRFAQVSGHILMLTVQHMVYAWDLAEKKKLWEMNLLGKNVNAQIMEVHTDADGTIRLMYADGTKIRIGQVGLLHPTYACLPTRDGLVAVDPANGNVLWKHDLPSGAQIFGDAEYVFAVEVNDEGNPTSTIVLRASDGVVVKAPDFTKLFHRSRRIGTIGRNLVLFDDDEQGRKTLRMYDALTGRDLWLRTYPSGSVLARSTERNLAGVVQPDGSLVVLDLASNKVLLGIDGPNAEVDAAMAPFRQVCASLGASTEPIDDRIRREHLASVDEVVLLQDGDSYYLALNKHEDQNSRSYPIVTPGLRPMRISGTLYRYSKSGRLEWLIDDNIVNRYLVLEDFDELPILILGSMVQRGNQSSSAELAAYDKQTGKRIFSADKNQRLLSNSQFYAMKTNAKKGVIELVRTDMRVKFEPVSGPRSGGSDKDDDSRTNVAPAGIEPNPQNPIRAQIGGVIRMAVPAQRVQIQVQIAPLPIAPPAPAKPADKPASDKPPAEKPAADKPKV